MMELKKYKLGELCVPNEIGVYGIPAPAEDYSSEKVRYLRISDISDDGVLLDNDKKSVSDENIEKYILEDNDIVFARTGNSTGRAYLYNPSDGELAFAGFLIKYKLDESKVNPIYMKYFTISDFYRQWVKNLSVGSTRGNISAQTFADCPVILPSRNQQNNLSVVLSSLDSKISLNRAINRNLEALAKQLYDYWFVQFDYPDENGKPYKSSGGKMVWNEVLKREIPKGWEVKKLNEWVEIKSGFPFASDSYLENGIYKVITIKNVQDGFLDTTGCDCLNEIPSKAKEYIKLDVGDRLISLTGNCGRLCVVTEENLLLNQRVGLLYCFDKTFVEYAYNLFMSKEIQMICSNLANGAAQANLSPIELCKADSIVPEKSILKKYNAVSMPIRQLIIKNSQEITFLTRQRDELLPLLMNEQVEVGE